MNKADLRLCKKKILKCLTEDFTYGNDGEKHNQAIFDRQGWQIFNGTDLDLVMDKIVLGLYFALEDSEA